LKVHSCFDLHSRSLNFIILGTYDSERVKQGPGVYVWMGPTSEEDETPVEKARYEGNYKDGFRQGVGKMKFPTGDIYEGEFFENQVSFRVVCLCFFQL
jgi:hypothetical protein